MPCLALPGHAPLFTDPRIFWARDELGPFNGLDLMELGPLEGAHTYMLDQFGANSITSIEANARAFLKCLCIKEIFGLKRVKFMLGDFNSYVDTCDKVDVIFASGVLYHMADPLLLLERMCKKSDRIFIWTHYYDDKVISRREDASLFSPLESTDGVYLWSRRLYPQQALSWSGFSGGPELFSIWLQRDSIIKFINDRGFSVKINFEQVDHVNGPAFAICAQRQF